MPRKLLQITDCHLGESEGERLVGLNTDESLGYVLQHMLAEHQTADLLVCSGDLSNEAGSAAYQRLQEKLPGHIPQAWLPGNHDDNRLMAEAAGEKCQFLATVDLGRWQVTLLDSSIPQKVSGFLADAEIERALAILQQHADKHHIFFLHHHLKPVGCKWLDTQVVGNAEQALAAFAQFPQLKLIVNGHVHQESVRQHGHLQLLSTPSTCIQFKPNSDDFALGDEMPGYRWFELFDDGSFATGVSRIDERPLTLDHSAHGY